MEKHLLYAIAKGDERAFEALYDTYFRQIYHFVLGYVKSPNLADDIVQEIFVKVWEKRETLASVELFKPYLYVMAKNQTLNQLRSISRSKASQQELLQHYVFSERSTENMIQNKEYQAFINNAFQQLSPAAQKVFSLCREAQMSYEDVAKEMGFSRHAVKKYMMQAMKTFRQLLSGPIDVNYIVVFFSLLGLLQ
ncbi:RNA polymerase sigma factor [Sphingobacterium paludis]|uniref:RNA polymerase sigma-70 factor (ECF subfamily) n=1 Tax=Sphingobacterium paludis TaxID=1476465 RepID=A0A4V3E1V2_9SPHI|nr:RNA polymerase sigma-70 factor [Sphingobacterium paludis]TDS14678.1 RNA polymerase sigma-70 factor (ECF subfamily) [Sphingobacterium paludis]